MLSFTWMKAKLAALGAAFLALLALIVRLNYLKRKNEQLAHKANTLEARHHINVVKKSIEKKKRKELSLSEKAIEEEKKKKPEDFSGYDTFSNPNDY